MSAMAAGRYNTNGGDHRRYYSDYNHDHVEYRVEKVRNKEGGTTEVLTIEDTPEPSETKTKRRRTSSVATTTKKSRRTSRQVRAVPSHVDNTHFPDTPVSQQPGSATYTDKNGHYVVVEGAVINDRYRIGVLLGQGTFGKVVSAYDTYSNREVAVKIIRAIPKYREASKIEIRVLNLIKERDPKNTNHCIHIQNCFDWKNHVCIVTELLGCSVYDFLKNNSYYPFPFSHVQEFGFQLVRSVAFLHRSKLVHTDLKPENILLEDASYITDETVKCKGKGVRRVLKNTGIRVIDFGSATFHSEYHASVVSTRHYRAPEIILEMGWSYPCDVWSVGCILIELFTGEALFQTHENVEHLAMMQRAVGDIPPRIAEKVYHTRNKDARENPHEWFKRDRRKRVVLAYPNANTSCDSLKYVKQVERLEKVVSGTDERSRLFLDLLLRMLKWEPDERITMSEAMAHPFFKAGR